MAEGVEEVDGRAENICRKYREFAHPGNVDFTDRVLFNGTFGGEPVQYYECIEPHSGCTHAYIKLTDRLSSFATKELKWMMKLAKGCTDGPYLHFAHFLGFQCHRNAHCLIFNTVTCKLSGYLRKSRLDMTQKYQLCEDMCKGLSFLHAFTPRVIHCAVTPESVLVCVKGTARLCDLSRARFLQECDQRHEVSNSIRRRISTLFGGAHLKKWMAMTNQKLRFTATEQAYLSPECRTQIVDDKHDVFCLGVVIMEVLTGNSPTLCGPVGRDEICHRRSHEIEALRQIHLPAVEVVQCCLRQDPAHRSPVDLVLEQLQRAKEAPTQLVRYQLKKELKPYKLSGFYRDKHYRKVDEQGGTDVCLLLNDESKPHSSLGSVGDAEDVLFLARVLRLTGGLLEEVEQTCKELSMSTHDNVAAFLGMIVEKRVQPHMDCVAHVFEEYAEVNMIDFFHHKSKWKLDADLFSQKGPDGAFRLVVHWSYQVFSALSYLHQLGIKHNKLYGNCVRMHRRTYYAVVEDFEVKISCFLGNSDVSKDVRQKYQSPESLENGRRALTWSADVWSVACNIVLMITGQHPWEGVDSEMVPYKLRQLVHSLSDGNSSPIINELIHEDVLNDELHPYQFKAITNLFQRVFLTTADKRLQAKNIVDHFFHVCPGGSDTGQEAVMLVVSESPNFNIPLYPIDKWTISCCPCSPTSQHNDNVGVSSDLPKKLAGRGIALRASAIFVLYGGVLQQGGRSMGPAVFFHSPLALESHDFHLRVPLYGAKSCCDNCAVSPFIGAYDQNSLSYVFRSNQPSNLIYTYHDPNYIVVGAKDTAIFRPSCASTAADPSPCCPAFEYEVHLYQARSTESGREISIVAFIKSRLWEAVVREQFGTDCKMVRSTTLASTWKQLDVEYSGGMQVFGQNHITQDDVDNIDSSPMQLQERVKDVRSYPPRVLLRGKDPCGCVQVKVCQTQILEYKWSDQGNRLKSAQIKPYADASGRQMDYKLEDAPLSRQVTDIESYLMLFRKHVSRKAASKGRAVLEGVGLHSTKIEACFNSHPLNEEEAVQAGLIAWSSEGQSHERATWAVLLEAMKYAELAKQDVDGLETALRHMAASVISRPRKCQDWSIRSLRRHT